MMNLGPRPRSDFVPGGNAVPFLHRLWKAEFVMVDVFIMSFDLRLLSIMFFALVFAEIFLSTVKP